MISHQVHHVINHFRKKSQFSEILETIRNTMQKSVHRYLVPVLQKFRSKFNQLKKIRPKFLAFDFPKKYFFSIFSVSSTAFWYFASVKWNSGVGGGRNLLVIGSSAISILPPPKIPNYLWSSSIFGKIVNEKWIWNSNFKYNLERLVFLAILTVRLF